jgi:endonuclease/exonuclease/phosphatase (EEP) superfamily protein YafD
VAAVLAVRSLTDRLAVVTLFAFGPRWVAFLPMPLLVWVVIRRVPIRHAWPSLLLLSAVSAVLVIGLLDYRMGLGAHSGPGQIRVLSHNVGESAVDLATFDRFLREHDIDVAALQECPFYTNAPATLGWQFFYGGDLCLVSRFPFRVDGVADPAHFWRRGIREPLQFTIESPAGQFRLVNVHFETIRPGVEAIARRHGPGIAALRHNREEAARDSTIAHQMVGRIAGPFLVAGDFNLPVESQIYRADWGSLTNAFSTCGAGLGHTKREPLFGIRIDHVLLSDEWTCVGARVLDTPYGGDHDALIVDLRLRRALGSVADES